MSSPNEGDRLGPVELLVVAFPAGVVGAAGFTALTDLTRRGVLTVLDLEFVRRRPDGAVEPVAVSEAVSSAVEDLIFLAAASTGLLDAEDVATVGGSLEPGTLAGVVLLEHAWMVGLIDAIESSGAHVLHSIPIAAVDVEAALDRLDAESVRPGGVT